MKFEFNPRLHGRALRGLEISTGLLTVALIAATFAAYAQGAPLIYPAKGQSPAQQDKDRFECYEWARAQSGFDPVQASAASTKSGPLPPPPIAMLRQKQAAEKQGAQRATYDRAFGACMDARGYSVR